MLATALATEGGIQAEANPSNAFNTTATVTTTTTAATSPPLPQSLDSTTQVSERSEEGDAPHETKVKMLQTLHLLMARVRGLRKMKREVRQRLRKHREKASSSDHKAQLAVDTDVGMADYAVLVKDAEEHLSNTVKQVLEFGVLTSRSDAPVQRNTFQASLIRKGLGLEEDGPAMPDKKWAVVHGMPKVSRPEEVMVPAVASEEGLNMEEVFASPDTRGKAIRLDAEALASIVRENLARGVPNEFFATVTLAILRLKGALRRFHSRWKQRKEGRIRAAEEEEAEAEQQRLEEEAIRRAKEASDKWEHLAKLSEEELPTLHRLMLFLFPLPPSDMGKSRSSEQAWGMRDVGNLLHREEVKVMKSKIPNLLHIALPSSELSSLGRNATDDADYTYTLPGGPTIRRGYNPLAGGKAKEGSGGARASAPNPLGSPRQHGGSSAASLEDQHETDDWKLLKDIEALDRDQSVAKELTANNPRIRNVKSMADVLSPREDFQGLPRGLRRLRSELRVDLASPHVAQAPVSTSAEESDDDEEEGVKLKQAAPVLPHTKSMRKQRSFRRYHSSRAIMEGARPVITPREGDSGPSSPRWPQPPSHPAPTTMASPRTVRVTEANASRAPLKVEPSWAEESDSSSTASTQADVVEDDDLMHNESLASIKSTIVAHSHSQAKIHDDGGSGEEAKESSDIVFPPGAEQTPAIEGRRLMARKRPGGVLYTRPGAAKGHHGLATTLASTMPSAGATAMPAEVPPLRIESKNLQALLSPRINSQAAEDEWKLPLVAPSFGGRHRDITMEAGGLSARGPSHQRMKAQSSSWLAGPESSSPANSAFPRINSYQVAPHWVARKQRPVKRTSPRLRSVVTGVQPPQVRSPTKPRPTLNLTGMAIVNGNNAMKHK